MTPEEIQAIRNLAVYDMLSPEDREKYKDILDETIPAHIREAMKQWKGQHNV